MMEKETYPGPRPSEETTEPWIYAISPTRQTQPPTEQCGKWMLFITPANVDAVWAIVRVATEKALLGGSAKVATMHPEQVRLYPNSKLICIYTYDGEDQEDVRRVLRSLRAIGITQHPLYWKFDKTTLAGQYSRPGQRVSRWSCQDFEAPRHGEVKQ